MTTQSRDSKFSAGARQSKNPVMDRDRVRAQVYHYKKTYDNDWTREDTWEERPVRPQKPTQRSQQWSRSTKPSKSKIFPNEREDRPHKQDAAAAIDFRSKTETAPSDEPLYDIGPHAASIAENELYAMNVDMGGYIDQVYQTYEVLRGLNPRLDRELPLSMFTHSMSTIANCTLLDRTLDNGERKMGTSGRMQDLLPDDLCIPDNLYHYLTNLGNTTTPNGEDIRINVPDIAIPQGPIQGADSGSFGIADVNTHNVYEAYISPLVTANRVIATRNQQAIWHPLPQGLCPQNSVPTQNLLGYGPIDALAPDAVPRINGFEFPNDDSPQGRLKICVELMTRVNAVLFNLRDKYKMRDIGTTTDRVRNYIKPKMVPANTTYCCVSGGTASTILGNQNCQIKSFSSFGSSAACQTNINAIHRERSEAAPGPCYLKREGGQIDGWSATRNGNFACAAPFIPTMGVDDPSLRVVKFVAHVPGGSRLASLQSYLKKNFVIK